MDIFRVIRERVELYLGVISMHLHLFFGSRYRMGDFGGLVKFQIILGALEIPDIFLSER